MKSKECEETKQKDKTYVDTEVANPDSTDTLQKTSNNLAEKPVENTITPEKTSDPNTTFDHSSANDLCHSAVTETILLSQD